MSMPQFETGPLGVTTLDPDTWVLTLDGRATPEQARQLGHQLGQAAPDGVELIIWDETDDDPRALAATAGGWRQTERKAFVELDLSEVPDQGLPQDVVAISLERLGEQEFARRMLHASVGDPFSQSSPGEALDDLRELIDHAEDAFDPLGWFALERNGAELGVVLPQVYPDDPLEGSLFYVGVVPSQRGKGYGKALHGFGLAQLKASGVRRYLGSTDERNAAMLRIFAAHGARVVRRQTLYRRPARTL